MQFLREGCRRGCGGPSDHDRYELVIIFKIPGLTAGIPQNWQGEFSRASDIFFIIGKMWDLGTAGLKGVAQIFATCTKVTSRLTKLAVLYRFLYEILWITCQNDFYFLEDLSSIVSRQEWPLLHSSSESHILDFWYKNSNLNYSSNFVFGDVGVRWLTPRGM